jgi:ribosomal protein L31E
MNTYTIIRPNLNKIHPSQIIEELKRVAKHYAFTRFTRHEFDKVSNTVKGTAVLKYFGTWESALQSIGTQLAIQKKDRSIIKNDVLFHEMDRIWQLIGHRPSKIEWDNNNPKFSYSTYKRRFNGWVNACKQFIEWKGIDLIPSYELQVKNHVAKKITQQDIRDIPLKLRLQIFKRDKFKCLLCGRSPASSPIIELHVDHIKPIAKGGKTNADNLQTLCNECNWGKGSDII